MPPTTMPAQAQLPDLKKEADTRKPERSLYSPGTQRQSIAISRVVASTPSRSITRNDGEDCVGPYGESKAS